MDVTGPGGVARPRLAGMSIGRGRSLKELIEAGEQSFSFEFFPPKDEAGEEQLARSVLSASVTAALPGPGAG